MKKIFVLILLGVFVLAACQSKVVDDKPPVIADDTQTPSDSDMAVPDPVEEPVKTCECDDKFDPVCANDQLFNNACTADCLGVKNYVKGECHDPTGMQLFPCAPTSGGLSAQHNPVCGRVYDVDTGITFWKTYPNAYTACQVDRAGKMNVKEFTRGECGI